MFKLLDVTILILLCIGKNCGNLGAPANGNIDMDSTLYMAEAFFSCITGYELSEKSVKSKQCLATGSWSDGEVECQSKS